ncbi:MAG: TIGR04282 family arsenosugar biosynthesis glycosyltransferase [Flavobacteriaceae bacterium]|nr:TIGR04282 family arsenosugar biosynthesis glycosyltransferase [Flavobacteriaceae bacterium]
MKNIKLGKVKKRLAKTIGNDSAFEVYNELVKITENITSNLQVEKHIYFSDAVMESKWKNDNKTVQKGIDLGERMKNAFLDGFSDGFEKIVLIGSDLPDLTANIIYDSFHKLSNNDIVIGPAQDGGYYLIGMSKMNHTIFENKPWSQSTLLEVTLQELQHNNQKTTLLQTLNDIDTFDDLINSTLYQNNLDLQNLITNTTDV